MAPLRHSSVWLSTGKTKIAVAPDIECLIGKAFTTGDSFSTSVRDGRKNPEEKANVGNVSFIKVNSLLSSGGRIRIMAAPPLKKSFETCFASFF
jgi:hypothetical protein